MEKFKKINNCFECNLKLNLFCYLADEQLGNINDNRQEVHFKAGETIFKSGGPLTHIICITKGMVNVYLEDENHSKRILVSIVKPVQLIGGPGFLVDNRHYITVKALEDTDACFVKIEDIKDAMRLNPEFSIEMVKYLNDKIIHHYDKLLNLNPTCKFRTKKIIIKKKFNFLVTEYQ